MKFKVQKLPQAQKEFSALEKSRQSAVQSDYDLIENAGLEFVKRRFLRDGLFEIKTNDVRSLFKYEENKIILVALIYQKKTKKVPEQLIKLALKRLKEAEL